MAYATANLILAIPRVGSGAGGADAGETAAVWTYRTDDTDATIEADVDYITDAVDKGLKQGDLVLATTNEAAGQAAGMYSVVMNADGVTAGLLSPATGRHS